jgi:hypothetical protein
VMICVGLLMNASTGRYQAKPFTADTSTATFDVRATFPPAVGHPEPDRGGVGPPPTNILTFSGGAGSDCACNTPRGTPTCATHTNIDNASAAEGHKTARRTGRYICTECLLMMIQRFRWQRPRSTAVRCEMPPEWTGSRPLHGTDAWNCRIPATQKADSESPFGDLRNTAQTARPVRVVDGDRRCNQGHMRAENPWPWFVHRLRRRASSPNIRPSDRSTARREPAARTRDRQGGSDPAPVKIFPSRQRHKTHARLLGTESVDPIQPVCDGQFPCSRLGGLPVIVGGPKRVRRSVSLFSWLRALTATLRPWSGEINW